MYEKIKDFQNSIIAVIILFAVICSAFITSDAIKKEGITVTGSAYKLVKSDTGLLRLDIKTKSVDKSTAYNLIQSKIPVVKEYLISQGVDESEITILTPNNYPTYKFDPRTGYSTNQIDSYNFSQVIQIKSSDVEKIKELSLNVQSLLDKGIDVNVNAPQYYYSKLGEIKVELLKEASEDAKQRAKGMLSATNNKVGKIRSVRMGVFQITPPDSNDVSDLGMNDVSSIEKKVTAVANVVFGIK